ncbi:CBS domain-containing protein [Methanococcus maripaludis]|uniref:CBS domain-containing protein n=2 Tax=Methanococcus maripaludis TaxID=39152 RepID=A0A7J9PFI9_METMI|nr:CBS domain-containing protein [Methanococcus maripaludis]MBA2862032.1 CBS domain-containing protein [Methanococcus maripaludis]
MKEQVIDIATKDVVTVNPDTPISKAVGIMENRKFHNLIIEKDDDIYLVTMHDLLLGNSVHQQVEDLMFKPYCVRMNTQVLDAAFEMINSGQRVAPVINENDKLIGIITDYDVMRCASQSELLKDVKIDKIMTKSPVTIDIDESIGKARSLMMKYNIGRLIVLDTEGNPMGMVTEDDIVKKVFKPKTKMTVGELTGDKMPRMAQPVSMIVNKPLITADEDDSIAAVADLMEKQDIRGVPIFKNDILRGIVTRLDILKYLRDLRAESMVEVEIQGDFDEDQRELAERILFNEIKKIAVYSKKIHWIKLAVKKERDKGGVPYYSVKTYVKTPRKLYVAEGKPKLSATKRIEWDGEEIELIAEKQRWDFIEVLKDALDSVKKQMSIDREKRQSKALNSGKKEIMAEEFSETPENEE